MILISLNLTCGVSIHLTANMLQEVETCVCVCLWKSEWTRGQRPFLLRTETCKMYISDKAVKCDNKILFNPVIYILIFVRFRDGEITPENAGAQLGIELLKLVGLRGGLAEGGEGNAVPCIWRTCHDCVGTEIP